MCSRAGVDFARIREAARRSLVRIHVELSDGTVCRSREDLDAAFGVHAPITNTIVALSQTFIRSPTLVRVP
jgi:hypothetical protein